MLPAKLIASKVCLYIKPDPILTHHPPAAHFGGRSLVRTGTLGEPGWVGGDTDRISGGSALVLAGAAGHLPTWAGSGQQPSRCHVGQPGTIQLCSARSPAHRRQ